VHICKSRTTPDHGARRGFLHPVDHPHDPAAAPPSSGRLFSTRTTARTPMTPFWELFGAEVFLMEVKLKAIYRFSANGEKA